MAVIEINNLTKRYGERIGVEGLSLTVEEGALYGFLGPNGAGKSTTIRTLLGFMRPTDGAASVFGRDCWKESHTIKADVGYISGDLRLYPWMTLRNSLDIVGRIRHRDMTGYGLELAERFELEPDVLVRKMSRGMRQKLGLIVALAHKPRVLILDEPTTALDPPMQRSVYEHLRERAGNGAAVFFSSHTLSEVEELCDRVAILKKGKLVANETIDALRERASRSIVLQWKSEKDSHNINPPPDLIVDTRNDTEWHCSFSGSVMDLIAWCHAQPLDDMSISPPDLNKLFYRYYDGGDHA